MPWTAWARWRPKAEDCRSNWAASRGKTITAALVRAGVGVETITARHHLEDAFIGLLEHQ